MDERIATVGIVGGTGPAGRALAARMASVGVEVVIGSRLVHRAEGICDELVDRWPGRDLAVRPAANAEAAAAQVVVLATPWEAAAETAAGLSAALAGKVVISMANALVKADGELRAATLATGSVAAAVQAAVPAALVAAAFHHLPARSLADLEQPVEGDVMVCSDHDEAGEVTSVLIRAMPRLRPVRAGSLANAAPVEAFTAVLLGINARYKGRSSIRLTGIGI